ncbi:UNVERIFIED_CONTAM: hypothetical protein GTU68_065312 [Idotea baltica]|nr:hypothetical protein [Idotea baltica]
MMKQKGGQKMASLLVLNGKMSRKIGNARIVV